MHEDDKLLEALVDTGDQSLWNQLIDRFGKSLFAVCYRILQDRQLAEDALQKTWTQIVRKIRTYNGSKNVKAWLFRIAHNTAIDLQRRDRTWRKSEQTSPFSEEEFDPDTAQLLIRLEQEIRELPVEHQAVLLLVSRKNEKRPGLGHATQRAIAEALDYCNDQGKPDHNRVNRILENAYTTLLQRLSSREEKQ